MKHRRRRRPGICRAVRADAAARAGRHGDGPRRRQRFWLSGRILAGAEAGRPDLDADRDRLYVRRHSDVPADGHAGQQFRHEPRAVPRRQRFRRGICAAGSGSATVAACAGFAAICGSSVATAATFSAVAYPEMRRFGYPQSFATGVIAGRRAPWARCCRRRRCLAVYGIITEQDIGKLFVAGIVPGLLAMMMYMITISLIGYFRPGLPADRSANQLARPLCGPEEHLGAGAAVHLRHRWALRPAVLPRLRRPKPAASAPPGRS